MATVAELRAVLKDTLEKRGALGQIKARIRAEVFNALDDQSEPRPPLSHENLLINELIREYLEYNKYKYASSVLTAALLAALSQTIPLVFKKSYPLLHILEENPLTEQLMQEQETLLAACKIKIPFLKYLLLLWKMADSIFKNFGEISFPESGQPEVPLDRQFLAKELNIVEDASGKSVPLLYAIVSHFLHGGKEESTQNTLPNVSLLYYPKQNLGKPPAERNQKDRIPEPGRMAGISIEEPLVLQSINR